MESLDIVIKPVLTEKSNLLRESNQYVFKVDVRANKFEVMSAIKDIYKVNPTSCNILNVKGKVKSNKPVSASSFKRGYGKTASWKKAIITLPAGESIDTVEGV